MSKPKLATYADLPEPASVRTLLYCPHCGNEYSATRGDYWDRLTERPVCYRCAEPLRLVRRETRFVRVRL